MYMAFRGTFEYNLDAKSRLTIPAKLREELAGALVLAQGIEDCVALWRTEEYEVYVESSFQGLHPLSPESRQLKRYFAANALDTELDSAGRIMIPPFLTEYARLEKAVVITGAVDCLEIWDKATWAIYNEDISARAPEIAALLHAPRKGEDPHE